MKTTIAYKPKSLANQAAVLAVLKDHIGKTCPTNSEIADMARMVVSQAEHAIRELVNQGIITRWKHGGKRWFTFKTGESTGPGDIRMKQTNRLERSYEKAVSLPAHIRHIDATNIPAQDGTTPNFQVPIARKTENINEKLLKIAEKMRTSSRFLP